MPFVVADRVKETTITTGTGTITLAGVATGFQSFAAIGNGNQTFYAIVHQILPEWEVGIGTYTSIGTTLSRDTVLSSSNSGAAVPFSAGTKDVFVTYPAGRSVFTNPANTFTAAQTFRATDAVRSEAAATQDAVVLSGRAGGTSSYATTLTPTTLSANRTLTLPDASGTILQSGTAVTVPQGGTGLSTTTAYGLIAAGTTSTGNFQQVSGTGTTGQVLTSNGAGVLPTWQSPSGLSWDPVQATGFTASVNKGYPVNTTSGAITVTLPASATRGDTIILVDYAGTWGTNACTISPNTSKIWGAGSNQKIIATRGACSLVYIDSTQGWLFYSGIYQFPNFFGGPPFSVEYLVQAGGGGGGASNPGGGGGGAGGQGSNINFVTSGGTSYTVTIGAGGANYANGSNSTFATITRTGGGRGANNFESNPPSGGCGGGGGGGNSYGQPGGLGNAGGYTPVEGYNGGNGGGNAQAGGSVRNGGGGGGTNGGGGWAGSSGSEGFGGAGLSTTIIGTSTFLGGGGGGTGTSSVGAGGAGGGGSGGGASGSANTGGGGGAGGGGGGSGIVIIAYPNNFADLASVGAGLVCNGSAGNTVSNTILRPGYKVYQFTSGTGTISW